MTYKRSKNVFNNLELDEFEKFEMICNEQKKNPADVLNSFMKQYNQKYKEHYEKALENFWENYCK